MPEAKTCAPDPARRGRPAPHRANTRQAAARALRTRCNVKLLAYVASPRRAREHGLLTRARCDARATASSTKLKRPRLARASAGSSWTLWWAPLTRASGAARATLGVSQHVGGEGGCCSCCLSCRCTGSCARPRRGHDTHKTFSSRAARVKHFWFAPGLALVAAHASAAAFQAEFDTIARQRRSSGTAQSARVVNTCKRVHCGAFWKWQQCFHCAAAPKCYLAH